MLGRAEGEDEVTEQEQFEADYLAAFPHRDGLMGRYHNDRYVCADIQDAFSVWLQQAKRHEAEKAELVAAGKWLINEVKMAVRVSVGMNEAAMALQTEIAKYEVTSHETNAGESGRRG